MAKRAGCAYVAGRSRGWLKIRASREARTAESVRGMEQMTRALTPRRAASYLRAANSAKAIVRSLSFTPGIAVRPVIQASSTVLLTPKRMASSSRPSKSLALASTFWAVLSGMLLRIYQSALRMARARSHISKVLNKACMKHRQQGKALRPTSSWDALATCLVENKSARRT